MADPIPVFFDSMEGDSNNGKPKGTQLSLKEIKQAAESGDAEARYELAELYEWSDECLRQGVPQKQDEAYKWFKRAAVQGKPEAMYIVGTMYETGKGVPQNIAKACQWYKKLAENLLCEPEYEDPVNQAMRDAERLGELEELLGEDA